MTRLLLFGAVLLFAGCDLVNPGGDDGGTGGSPHSYGTTAGCLSAAAAGSASELGCGLSQSSGISSVDAALSQDLSILPSFFAVRAAFSFFDECSPQYMNAYASPNGFVVFGRYFAQAFWQRTGSTIPHSAILAHEFGHIFQLAHNWQPGLPGPVIEMEADAWSGFYGALVKSEAGSDLNLYYQQMFAMGDFNFNSPGHHGTPVQRLAAGALGLLVAIEVAKNPGQPPPSPDVLHAFFVDRIQNCIMQVQNTSTCLELVSVPDVTEARTLLSRDGNELILGIVNGRRSISEIRGLTEDERGFANAYMLGGDWALR